MAILFYDHLVDKGEVLIVIESLEVPEDRKIHLKEMVDDILHHGILETVLQKLHPHHHDRFLKQMTEAPYDPKLLEYLKSHIDDQIEMEIESRSRSLITEILSDLKQESGPR